MFPGLSGQNDSIKHRKVKNNRKFSSVICRTIELLSAKANALETETTAIPQDSVNY